MIHYAFNVNNEEKVMPKYIEPTLKVVGKSTTGTIIGAICGASWGALFGMCAGPGGSVTGLAVGAKVGAACGAKSAALLTADDDVKKCMVEFTGSMEAIEDKKKSTPETQEMTDTHSLRLR